MLWASSRAHVSEHSTAVRSPATAPASRRHAVAAAIWADGERPIESASSASRQSPRSPCAARRRCSGRNASSSAATCGRAAPRSDRENDPCWPGTTHTCAEDHGSGSYFTSARACGRFCQPLRGEWKVPLPCTPRASSWRATLAAWCHPDRERESVRPAPSPPCGEGS